MGGIISQAGGPDGEEGKQEAWKAGTPFLSFLAATVAAAPFYLSWRQRGDKRSRQETQSPLFYVYTVYGKHLLLYR